MKKAWIFLCMLLGLATTVQSQTSKYEGVLINPNGLAVDTFNNTTSEGPWTKIGGEDIKAFSFSLNLTSISGTVAGKVYLQGADKSGQWTFPYLDSLTLAAGSNNWNLKQSSPPAFQFYRLYIVPTGTQATSYTAYYYLRK